MKKSSPLVIVIPLIIALIVVGSVAVVKYLSPVPKESKAATQTGTISSEIPSFSGSAGSPAAGFDALQQANPVSDLEEDLNASKDSGDSEINDLEKEADSL